MGQDTIEILHKFNTKGSREKHVEFRGGLEYYV